MHWLIHYGLLLTIVKLSYQSRCPYSEMLASATNAINRGAYASDFNPYAVDGLHAAKPVPESSLSQNYLNQDYENYGAALGGPYGEGAHNNVVAPESNFLMTQNYLTQTPNNYQSSSADDPFGEAALNSLIDGSSKMTCAVPPLSCANDSSVLYYRSFDGSCNNLAHPGYGMANSRYGRILKPKYGDGKYMPSRSMSGAALPNPRILSLSLYGDDTLLDSTRTLLTMQWGQVVGHDISDFMDGGAGDCCEKPNNKLCYSIPMHVYGPITLASGKTCLSFARSLSDADLSCPDSNLGYAEKLSKTTPYLDLSSVYGNSLEQNIKLRQYHGGLLKTTSYNNQQFLPMTSNANGECMKNFDQCYNIPDKRNQLLPTIAVLQTILVREHNRLASILAKLNPHYSDEQLFQEARKINIAQYQKISYYDWLPLLLGPMYSYTNRLLHNVGPYDYVNDYDETWDATAYAENAAGAFRYAHNQIPGWFSLVSPDRHHNQTLRLSNYFKRPETMQLLQSGRNFDDLVRGLITQLQKRADANLDKEIKHYLDRSVFEEFGSDLKSFDIQRGRDFGLPSYNDYREFCGLPRANDWSGFADEINPEKIALMQKFYASPNDVDLNVGGSLEKHSSEAIFGPTFQCIMAKQFLKTRKADRFFFENNNAYTGFTTEQLAEIRQVSLAGILCANTASLKCVQSDVFLFPNDDNGLTSCNSIPQLNLKLWQDRSGY